VQLAHKARGCTRLRSWACRRAPDLLLSGCVYPVARSLCARASLVAARGPDSLAFITNIIFVIVVRTGAGFVVVAGQHVGSLAAAAVASETVARRCALAVAIVACLALATAARGTLGWGRVTGAGHGQPWRAGRRRDAWRGGARGGDSHFVLREEVPYDAGGGIIAAARLQGAVDGGRVDVRLDEARQVEDAILCGRA